MYLVNSPKILSRGDSPITTKSLVSIHSPIIYPLPCMVHISYQIRHTLNDYNIHSTCYIICTQLLYSVKHGGIKLIKKHTS